MEQNNLLFIAFQQGYARRNSNNFSRDWYEFKTNHAHLFQPPSPAKPSANGELLGFLEIEIEKANKNGKDCNLKDGDLNRAQAWYSAAEAFSIVKNKITELLNTPRGHESNIINCPSCNAVWNLSRHNSCQCGATLVTKASPAKAEQEGPWKSMEQEEPKYGMLRFVRGVILNPEPGITNGEKVHTINQFWDIANYRSYTKKWSCEDDNRKVTHWMDIPPIEASADAKQEHPGPWKYEVHHVQHQEDADEYATITDGKVTLFIDGGQDDGDEQKVVNLLNQLKIKLDYDHDAELYASQLEKLYKEASAEIYRFRNQEQEGLRWVKASDLKELPAGSQFYKHFDEKGLGEFVDGSFYSSTGEIGSNQFIVLEILKEYNPPAHVDPITFAKYAWSRVKSWNKETGEIGVYYDKNSTWDKLLESYRAVESTTPPVKEARQPRNLPIEELIKLSDEELNVEINKVRSRLGMGKSEESGQPADDKPFDENLTYELIARFVANSGEKDSIKKIRKEAFIDGALWAKKYLESRQQPVEQSAVWVKGDYERLYNQIKGGKRTVCYIDHPRFFQQRDICTIKPNNPDMEFTSRGHGYGGINDPGYCGSEIERFIQLCRGLNAEWLDESGLASSRERDLIVLYKEYIHLLGEEIDSLIPIAHTHGWRSERHEKGVQLRAKIEALTQKI